jgi:hypothetical protein
MVDSDVGCFNWSRNLTHLYLQCPSSDNGDLCCHLACLTDYVSDHANNVMEHGYMIDINHMNLNVLWKVTILEDILVDKGVHSHCTCELYTAVTGKENFMTVST